jgi:hypothetical protein
MAGDKSPTDYGYADAWLVRTGSEGIIPEIPAGFIPAFLLIATTLIRFLTKKRSQHQLARVSILMHELQRSGAGIS